MANFIGLYYPFIHFKDETWLKTTALYWDRIKRIVPSGYELHDSETVKTLDGELGLIENLAPSPDDEWPVRDPFVHFLESHAPQLGEKYGVANRDQWAEDAITSRYAPEGSDNRLAYVHLEKIWPELMDTLVNTKLAVVGRADDQQWIGMHPKIANIYMTALAEHMSDGRGWYPITDETLDQLAVSGFSMERLSRALLDDDSLIGNAPSAEEIRVELANVCIEAVIPKGVADVPVEKIVELRKNHGTELAAFQEYLGEFRSQAGNLVGITDRQALHEHLHLHYQKTLKPSIEEVRKAFQTVKIETATGIMNTSFAVPAAVGGVAASLGLAVNPLLGGVAGFALGVIPTLQKRRQEAQEATKKPGAWLLRVEEDLKAETFLGWVRAAARKFVLDV